MMRWRRPGCALAAAAAVGREPVRAVAVVVPVGVGPVCSVAAGDGGGDGVAGTILLELPAVMEKGAPRHAAIIPLRSSSGGVARVWELGGVADVYSGKEDPSSPQG